MPSAILVRATPAPTPAPAFAPSHLEFKGLVDLSQLMPGVTARLEQRMDLRPVADGFTPDVTTQRFQMIKAGTVVQEQVKEAKITPQEREAAAAVRDALLGTSFLKDAKPHVDGDAALNTLRMSWANADGTKSMIEFPATGMPAGYEGLQGALMAYSKLTGLSDKR